MSVAQQHSEVGYADTVSASCEHVPDCHKGVGDVSSARPVVDGLDSLDDVLLLGVGIEVELHGGDVVEGDEADPDHGEVQLVHDADDEVLEQSEAGAADRTGHIQHEDDVGVTITSWGEMGKQSGIKIDISLSKMLSLCFRYFLQCLLCMPMSCLT